MLKLYSTYVKETITKMVKDAGGMRKLEKIIGVNHGQISRVISGKYVPSPQTFIKWTGRDILLYVDEVRK